nr:immunoglobulin heavy chain junction region [Mus musculus]
YIFLCKRRPLGCY